MTRSNRKRQSLRVRIERIEQVKLAVKRNGFPNQETLAKTLGLALSTVSSFLNGKPVDFLNFLEICRFLALDWEEVAYLNDDTSSTEDDDLEGPVPISSAFYIERPPIEARCYQAILRPGTLIRIKAPRQMGKTSLMTRILSETRKQGYRTATLNFLDAGSSALGDLDQFLRWFCCIVSQQLELPDRLAERWHQDFSGNHNSNVYFEKYLLKETANPVSLGLDEVDCLFEQPKVAEEFFGLLRGWYEKARYGDESSHIWSKLRLVLAHSTEVYIPLPTNRSPFNVGEAIKLIEFDQKQVQGLAQRYQIHWHHTQVQQLMDAVGGHPYLVRKALHEVRQNTTLDRLLETAPTEAGIYKDHLRRHLWNLEQYPALAMALSQVVATSKPLKLTAELAFKLESMGLVHLQGNEVVIRCNLYREYFRNRL